MKYFSIHTFLGKKWKREKVSDNSDFQFKESSLITNEEDTSNISSIKTEVNQTLHLNEPKKEDEEFYEMVHPFFPGTLIQNQQKAKQILKLKGKEKIEFFRDQLLFLVYYRKKNDVFIQVKTESFRELEKTNRNLIFDTFSKMFYKKNRTIKLSENDKR